LHTAAKQTRFALRALFTFKAIRVADIGSIAFGAGLYGLAGIDIERFATSKAQVRNIVANALGQ
jgi:hypothetical protein